MLHVCIKVASAVRFVIDKLFFEPFGILFTLKFNLVVQQQKQSSFEVTALTYMPINSNFYKTTFATHSDSF